MFHHKIVHSLTVSSPQLNLISNVCRQFLWASSEGFDSVRETLWNPISVVETWFETVVFK